MTSEEKEPFELKISDFTHTHTHRILLKVEFRAKLACEKQTSCVILQVVFFHGRKDQTRIAIELQLSESSQVIYTDRTAQLSGCASCIEPQQLQFPVTHMSSCIF